MASDITIFFTTKASNGNDPNFFTEIELKYQTELLCEADKDLKCVLKKHDKVKLAGSDKERFKLFQRMCECDRNLSDQESKSKKIQIYGTWLSDDPAQSTTNASSSINLKNKVVPTDKSTKFRVAVWEFPYYYSPTNERGADTVLTAPISKLYLPNFINTIFIIGENASGKSILLSSLGVTGILKPRDVLVVSPAQAIAKDDSSGSYYKSSHKPVEPSSIDIDLMTQILDSGQEQTLYNRFKSIAHGWEIELVKASYIKTLKQENDMNPGNYPLTSVFFKRIVPDSRETVAFYRYESVSDGIRQIFHVLLRCWDISCYQTVCLDEPESHLHPCLYCGLVREIISALGWGDPKNLAEKKLIIATHDFHLIDLLANLPEVHGVVFEISSTPIQNAPKNLKELIIGYDSTAQASGADNQLNAPLFSSIKLDCNSLDVFDCSQNRSNLITFSSSLIECMTGTAPLVLFCEGSESKKNIDSALYSLLFDRNKIEIRAVHGGYSAVQKKTIATREAQKVLRSPRHYYGLCDRDRNLGISVPDVIVLPVAEAENLFWMPELWPLFSKMLNQIGPSLSSTTFNSKKEKFWKEFQKLTGRRIFYYMIEYEACHYSGLAKQDTPEEARQNAMRNFKDQPHMLQIKMKNLRTNRLDCRIKFHKQWKDALNDARKYTLAYIDGKGDKEIIKKLYDCKQPTLKFDDLVKSPTENDEKIVLGSPIPSLSPKALLCALVRLSRCERETDISFLAYYHLLNEKEVLDIMEKTVFALKQSCLKSCCSHILFPEA
ncbi:unnamed protein product [Rotaria socialis]|uniref:ATPase AAA-type core domain-containing protein n=1 Tax=Rotaria socialis TaxID=392032 RepID=A0A818DD76_9BILA|nr:unnamed protein product [Rotaria socialis]CAF3444771.1 unnamed protein product [Rotaria socialis]CAF4357469.1 unnamed protein product [Rotaria socialis]CAF4547165.1 unnamed protein product [Rotaria socialis]